MRDRMKLASGLTCLLRQPEPADANRIYQAVEASRAELSEWMPWCTPSYSQADASQWIDISIQGWRAGTDYHLSIMDESDLLYLGICGLHHIDKQRRSASLGYWVRTGYTGQGIATAAAMQLVKFAFTELDLMRVEILAGRENHPSQRVLEKLGATREGVLRNGLMQYGQPIEAIMYSLIPTDLDS